MNQRITLKVTDKLMVGNIDNGEPEYIDVSQLLTLAGAGSGSLFKEGYRWLKGNGNVDLVNWQVGDEGIGVGTFFPGYVVHFYVKTAPMTDPLTHLTILSSTPL